MMNKSKIFDISFLITGILLFVVLYFYNEEDYVSFISGLCGCISVVLCSQKKMSYYIFGFIQLGTYLYIVIQQNLYGEIWENVFYMITMIAGIFIWINHYNKEEREVDVKKLGPFGWFMTISIFAATAIICYDILIHTDDPQPLLDTISTIPAFIAQILMIFRYRDQWIFWLIVDITTLILWIHLENSYMIAQYIFWTLNCVYGFLKWSK